MKPTAQRRRDRRDLLDNLLSRALRGRLTTAEAALLAESVREEQRAYDQTRRSLGETGTAYGKHRAAADDAIREMEQRALDAEEQLTAYRSVLGPRPLDRIRDAEQRAAQAEAEAEGYRAAEKYRQAVADTFAGRLDAIRQQTAEGLVEGFEELTKRAEQAEELLTAAHQCSNDAEAERTRQHERAEQAIRRAAEEYDRRQAAEQRLAEVIATTTEALDASHATIVRNHDRAEAAEAALDEQRQALAAALHAREDHEWPALIDWAAQAHEWAARAAVKADRKRVEELEHERAVIAAELHAVRHKADTYRAAWHSARDRARRHAAEEKRVRGWLEHWADRARDAEPRAERYRLAWLACRRDRKADRAAMAAELPFVEAGHKALADEAAKWWRCHICRVLTDTDPCHICDSDRPVPDATP